MATATQRDQREDNGDDRPTKRARVDIPNPNDQTTASSIAGQTSDNEDVEDDAEESEAAEPIRASDLYLDTVRCQISTCSEYHL